VSCVFHKLCLLHRPSERPLRFCRESWEHAESIVSERFLLAGYKDDTQAVSNNVPPQREINSRLLLGGRGTIVSYVAYYSERGNNGNPTDGEKPLQ
jgi:hypothetical protein